MYIQFVLYHTVCKHTVYSTNYFKVNESINSNMSNGLLMGSTKSSKKAKEPKEKSSRMQLKQFTFDQSLMDGYF